MAKSYTNTGESFAGPGAMETEPLIFFNSPENFGLSFAATIPDDVLAVVKKMGDPTINKDQIIQLDRPNRPNKPNKGKAGLAQ